MHHKIAELGVHTRPLWIRLAQEMSAVGAWTWCGQVILCFMIEFYIVKVAVNNSIAKCTFPVFQSSTTETVINHCPAASTALTERATQPYSLFERHLCKAGD